MYSFRKSGFIPRMYYSCRKITVLVCILCLCRMFIFYYENIPQIKGAPLSPLYMNATKKLTGITEMSNIPEEKRYIIDTPGCRIPLLEISPRSMEKFFTMDEALNCTIPNKPDLTESKGNVLYLFPEKIEAYLPNNVTPKYLKKIIALREAMFTGKKKKSLPSLKESLKEISVSCGYQNIERITQSVDNYDDDCDRMWRLGEYIEITELQTTVKDFDGIVVTCNETEEFYLNVHHLIQKRTNKQAQATSSDSPKLSILLFGTDTVSRNSFLRSNPKTYNYLMDELKAFDFKGYNKVARFTFEHLVPVLSGLLGEELLANECYTNRTGAKGDAAKFDDCPFIWKEFKKRGYITTLFEDAPYMALFQWLATGFVNLPTDHCGRPSFLASDELIGWEHDDKCQRNKLALEVLHDYALDILNTYTDEPTFSLIWAISLTHSTLETVSVADDPHLRFLKALKKSGGLNRTILFFMSDHGYRRGEFPETLLGKIEESMPYLYVVIPEWFREKFPEVINNMEKNTNVLTSPFDLHNTLVDIMDMNYENSSHVAAKPNKTERGISLFQEITDIRTCEDIGIAYKNCLCQEYSPMKNFTAISKSVEVYMINHLNQMLKHLPKCATVQKMHVENILLGERDEDHFEKVTEEIISVQAKYFPGDALIDATLIWDRNAMSFQITGDISRINAYGNQSHCITDRLLQKYCICKDILQNGVNETSLPT